jgi:2-haloacid dehalogenase
MVACRACREAQQCGMSSPLPSSVTAIVFDAYGTLFDVHSAVARHAASIGPDGQRLSEMWRAKHLEYTWVLSLAGQWRDFAVLAAEALDYALARHPSVDPRTKAPLLEAYRELSAFPDARPLLERLRARGLRTAILSNGTRELLGAVVAANGMDALFDAVLSVDEVRVFKPHPRVYDLVGRHLGTTPRAVAFVSSNRWDVAGASAYGFQPWWINRGGLPDEYSALPPAGVLTGLDDLA